MTNRVAENHSTPTPRALRPAKSLQRKLDNFGDFVEPIQSLVLKYPGAALASAFLVGVAIAWWIKRR
jgi:hypothetical protein